MRPLPWCARRTHILLAIAWPPCALACSHRCLLIRDVLTMPPCSQVHSRLKVFKAHSLCP
jgi:hypothetical protein